MLSSDPFFYTTPFNHQLEEFKRTKQRKAWARFWEQGTGKTKTSIDEATFLFESGEIEGVFIIAPNGVHRNWIVEEVPRHLHPRVPHRAEWFSTQLSKTRPHEKKIADLVTAPKNTLCFLAMSYDSLMTEAGRLAARAFMVNRRCLYIADESRRIKEPTAKRTKRVLASSAYAPYRRILNGTPIANGPFDLYAQIQFLDPDFWEKKGIGSFLGYRTTFANYKPIKVAGGRIVQVVDQYKNLDMLARWIDDISSRVTKDTVLDLPPKIFTTKSFDMTSSQWKIYNELKNEFVALLGTGMVTASLALTRLLRLQQVTCGYVPQDEDGFLVDIGTENPRMDLLKEICEDLPHKCIIWSRFSSDITRICAHLGDLAVRYDGKVDDAGRAVALERFQKPGGDAQFFVANAQAAGEGLTLHAAKTVIYYSNSFNLAERLQSEDRAHRIGQDQSVNYIDFMASGTVDEHIAKALVSKLDIASAVLGDSVRTWLA